jgi:DNA-binding transcriptional regulator YhcF (GntR family)
MSRFDNGWFKFYRRAFFDDIGRNPICFALWSALLSMATYFETKIIWKGTQKTLPPGSVVFGITELATKWECSKSTIWRWLQYLASTDRICIESGTQGTIVTIRNWELYQTESESSETLVQHGPNTDRTRTEREENLNEEGRIKNKEYTIRKKNRLRLLGQYRNFLGALSWRKNYRP